MALILKECLEKYFQWESLNAVPIVKMKVGEPQPAKGGALEGTFHCPGQMMKAEQPHSVPGLGQSGE